MVENKTSKSDSNAGDKAERLINLILALLSAKKFLTKSQIFDVVKVRGEAAYQGAIESKDRMFERDKDDLRGMGIIIEVGGLDPLFDDEAGYRIKESQYALSLPDLTPEELATLSVAATFWRDSALSKESQSALRRLQSLGIPADTSNVGLVDLRYQSVDANFEVLDEAIESRSRVNFEYSGHSNSKRMVEPYALILWNGFWYLIARDIDQSELRMFKLVRIVGEVTKSGKAQAFEIPEGFDAQAHVRKALFEETQSATVRIRGGSALALTTKGVEVARDQSWTTYQFSYDSPVVFARNLLWFGSDVEVLTPDSLRMDMVRILEQVAHG